MKRGEGQRSPAALWPQLQEEQHAEADAEDPKRRSIIESESNSRLRDTESPYATLPHNCRHFSTLALSASDTDKPTVAHTPSTSTTVPLSQNSGVRVVKGRSSRLNLELVAPRSGDGQPLTVKQELPTYSVRTVVRQEDHPLWSSSPQMQLEYLFGRATLGQGGLRRDGYINYPKGWDAPARKQRSSLSPAEEPCKGGWSTPLATIEWRQDTRLPNVLLPPPSQQQQQLATTAVGAETVFSERGQRFAVAPPLEPQAGFQRIRLRDFATHVSILLRDECVCRQAIVAEERQEAVLDIVMVPDVTLRSLHPALLAGIEETAILEEICRRYILEEEVCQRTPIWDFYVFEHRCLVIGLAPLKRLLLQWILYYRGRKQRHLEQQNCLMRREEKSRRELTHRWLAAQQKLFASLVVATEALFRALIEELQLCTQYAHGFASICLKEQVELFPLLYGAVMPRVVVCGRISGYTRFKQLDLHDQHERRYLSTWEERDRLVISYIMQREALVGFVEGPRRQTIVEEESVARMKLAFTLFAMAERCHRREIEIVEACEWQIDLLPYLCAALAPVGQRPEEKRTTFLFLTKMQGCPT
ncbi:hypothetical protein TraAM80_04214 [Trypanosoma rangeli]|uniref:Uncharacterized protein n=1 Tax=Trypanosoma rangeli TaxID=5698 RepID=A0A3R7L1W3_TRYRA|nr:uncharacterized protein TraAM80_04214 [Trypanosoma rangeli]RNF05915.1 hypothetical protein TraAM80_04214 [Trypanosoma rangeli]|eukprot:RNF05915.1 hypothetical protein TraAM80_04214 [Trypanosoma rangeli]